MDYEKMWNELRETVIILRNGEEWDRAIEAYDTVLAHMNLIEEGKEPYVGDEDDE